MEDPEIWKKLRIERLAVKHLDILKNFKVNETKPDEKDLKDFLIDDAFKNQEQDFISRTYLVFFNPEDKLAGYITLMADNIHIKNTTLEEIFRKKDVEYKSLPSLKIGRMCVDLAFRKRGLGTFLVRVAMKRLLEIGERVGCRFLLTDAKPDAVPFYKHLEYPFIPLKQGKTKGYMTMYIDMQKQIEHLRKHKKIVPFTDIK